MCGDRGEEGFGFFVDSLFVVWLGWEFVFVLGGFVDWVEGFGSVLVFIFICVVLVWI